MLQNPHVLVTFDQVDNPLRLPRETASEPPKIVRTWCALHILTWKCASRHNGVHFFDILTSKSGPELVCFVHLVRTWCAFYILTWKCASRHNGVHFFDIPTSKSAPRPRCFVHFDLQMCFAPQRRAIVHLSSGQLAPHPPLSEPTFRPSGATNHWKNTVFRDFPTFSRICTFFLLTFSSTLLSSNLSLLSASSLLCFPSVHIVGSLTSKLPSTTTTTHYSTLMASQHTNYITLQLQLQLQLQLNYGRLCSTKLITLHCTPLHETTLHYAPLHYTTLNYTQVHYNNKSNNNNYYCYYCYYCYYYYYNNYYCCCYNNNNSNNNYYYYCCCCCCYCYCYRYLLPATRYPLPATRYLLPATCYLLPATAAAAAATTTTT